MTTSSLARPAFSQQEPAWPRLPAAPGQVTRSLCYRGLAALVNLSPALVITGCVATGRAAGLLRTALAASLTRRTALAAGLAVTASYALAQAPWALLTTVLARAVPSEAEPGLLTPWAVPGWVLACLGAQLFVLIFVLLQDSGLRASWSWALTGLIVIGIGGSILAGAVAEAEGHLGWAAGAIHAFRPSADLVLIPWSAGLASWGWPLLLGPALAARTVLRWKPRG